MSYAQNTYLTPALTSTEQTRLARPHSIRAYLSPFVATTVATAVVDGTLTWPVTLLPVRSVSGVWLAMPPYLTAEIYRAGLTPPIAQYRVRMTPTSTSSLPIMEVSQGDPGLLNADLRNVYPQDGDTVIVKTRRDLWTALPNISGGSVYEDAVTYPNWISSNGATNSVPEPILNLGKHRTQRIDPGQTYATMTFTAVALPWLATQTTFTYAWTIPGTWTVTSGSSSTATFTAHVPPGQYVLACSCIVSTAPYSPYVYAYRKVTVFDQSTVSLVPIADISSDVRDRTGRRMTLGFYGQALASDIPDGVMVDYVEEPSWGGLDVSTATRNFTGWIVREPWLLDYGTTGTETEIVGPAGLLENLGGYSLYLYPDAGVLSNFYGLNPTLCTIPFAIWYLLRLRAPNVLQLFDHWPRVMDSSYFQFAALNIPQGSLLEQVQTLAAAMNCNYGHDSTGAAWVTRHRSLYQPYSQRSGIYSELFTRDVQTRAEMQPPTIVREMRPKTKISRTEGLFMSSSTLFAVVAEAPGEAPGLGTATDAPGGIILNGVDESAATLAGAKYALANNPFPSVGIPIPDNRDVYEPAQMQTVELQIPAGSTPDNVAWDKFGIVQRVSKSFDKEGMTAAIGLELEMETVGVDGTTISTGF